jgi:curved DNA-binding protein
MTNHYTTLGVSETATQEEIKKSYRALAMMHHPDRGGDLSVFQGVSAAYDTIGDKDKREEYDQSRRSSQQPRFHTGSQDFHDIFGGANPFGNMFGQRRQQHRNRDLNIQCTISLLDSFAGKQLEAKFKLPSGRAESVVINLPAGIESGSTIRYQGLGDDSLPNVPRGNLNVTIVIMGDPVFRRVGNDLYTTIFINPIEAMIGCKRTIKTLSGTDLELDIRAGIDSHTEFASNGTGFPNIHNQLVGRFITVVIIQTPAVTDPILVEQLKTINLALNKGK